MNEELVIELTRKELGLLKDLSRVLKEERDAIISFSLEGIIEESNRKEEILKKLEFLKGEKEKLFEKSDDGLSAMKNGQTWDALCREMNHTLKDVRGGMEKNMKLLSFSMDHVRSSIENIVGLLNRSVYGKKRERVSLLLSRSV